MFRFLIIILFFFPKGMNIYTKTIDESRNSFISTKKSIDSYVPSKSQLRKRYPSVKKILKQRQFSDSHEYQRVEPKNNSFSGQGGLNLCLKGGKVLVYHLQTIKQSQKIINNTKKLQNKINLKKIIEQGRKFFHGNNKIKIRNKQSSSSRFGNTHKSFHQQFETQRIFNTTKAKAMSAKQILTQNSQIIESNSSLQHETKTKNDLFSKQIKSSSFTTIYKSENPKSHYYQNPTTKSKTYEQVNKNVKRLVLRKHTHFSINNEENIKRKRVLYKNNFDVKQTTKKDETKNIFNNLRKEKITITHSFVQPINNKPLFYFNQWQLTNIRAQSFVITEYPSRQLLAGNSSKKLAEIASLTKIMTFYTVMKIVKLFQIDIDTQIIKIDEHVQAMTGTSAQLCEGDQYTVKQLLYGMMLPSGNDAAIALAKWGGSILSQNVKQQMQNSSKVKNFLAYMNKCAKNIGMKLSRFANPHGLPNPSNLSNPQQISMLVHECLSDQLFRKIVSTKLFKCWTNNNNIKRQVVWQNTNKLLRRQGFIGVKTGVTVSAGPCLATCYTTGSKTFIIVLLRTTKLSRRFKQTRYILAMALQKLDYRQYSNHITKLYEDNSQLDSDNSEQQQQFNYERRDAAQFSKRNKILANEM